MDFEEIRDEYAADDDIISDEDKLTLVGVIRYLVLYVAIAALIFSVLTMLFRPAVTQGSSMEPTLLEGDQCLIMIFNYTPKRGDIAVMENPQIDGKYIVKRIIALAGDVLDIDPVTGAVIINGVLQEESYIKESTNTIYDSEFPLEIPEGTVFVMGDNRNNSIDSRTIASGPIQESALVGKVVFRFHPYDRISLLTAVV